MNLKLVRTGLGALGLAALAWALLRHLRPGHFYSEDYAVYLQETLNLLHHRPLASTGIRYWFDPNLPLILQSPLSYPPIIPALYALPVALFGLDLSALKLFQVAIALAGLVAAAAAMRRSALRWPEVLAALLLFALAPSLARDVNTIGADLPFILFQSLALLAALALQRASTRAAAWRAGVMLGVMIWLCVGARTAAVALVPAVLAADVIALRRVRPVLLVPLGTAAALYALQTLLFGRGSAYGYIFHYRFFDLAHTPRTLLWALARLLDGTPLAAVSTPLMLLFVALAGVGVAVRAVAGCPIAWWLASTTAMLLVLPDFDAGTRYLIPHLVFAGAFAVRGTWVLLGLVRPPSRSRSAMSFVPTLALAGAFALVPAWPPGPLASGVMTPASQEMLAKVDTLFARGDTVASTVHRSLHLFTGRRTIRLPVAADAGQLRAWLETYGVDGIVLRYAPATGRYGFSDCPATPACSIGAAALGLHEVFRNQDWLIWRRR